MPERRVHAPSGTPVVIVGEPGDRGGVVLVSEVWGITPDLRRWADRLVAEGFAVALPDLWWRRGGPPPLDTVEDIRAAVSSLDDGQALRDVAAAAALLDSAQPRVVLGFCMGGLYARLAAAAVPGFAAAVEFYGRIVYPTLTEQKPTQPLDLLPGRSCPLLCHFGSDDASSPPHHVDELERRLANQGLPAQVFRYPGVGHAFMNADRASHAPAAAELAWARTLRFLDEVLPA